MSDDDYPRLPCSENAFVSTSKIKEYLLNRNHPDGGGKAAFFEMMGFSLSASDVFVKSLIQHGARRKLIDTVSTRYGRKYTVSCVLETPNGKNPCVNTVWIVEPNAREPRLITAYPARGKMRHD